MADPASSSYAVPPRRTAVWRTPGMLALVVVSVAGFGGFSVLLSVAPLWVVRGGAGSIGSGLVTGVLLFSTILTQTAVPWLLRRFGYAAVLTVGLLALAGPSLVLGLSDRLAPVLALSAVRGTGFGILTVTGSTVVAHLVPQERRGAAIGTYGLAVAVPNLVLLPASVPIADLYGFGYVFALGAVPVLGIPASWRLARALARAEEDTRLGRSLEDAAPTRGVVTSAVPPSVVLFAVTLAGGGLVTFLPQMTPSATVSAAGLFALGLCAALSRWGAGHLADRWGARRMVAPLLVLAATGLAVIAAAVSAGANPGLLLLGLAVTGISYGALQNLTLVVAFGAVDPRGYGAASAVWNIGFDAGTAAGAVLLGVVAAASGFVTGLLVLAALALAALPLSPRRQQGPRNVGVSAPH
jgi:MFS family permease